MTPLTRKRPCPICAKPTQQTLQPTTTGAEWACEAGHAAQTYTQADMLDLMGTVGARIPKIEPPVVPDLTGVHVFIEGVVGEELELDPQFTRMHAEITGALPVKGEPLKRRIDNVPYPFNVFSYGKVTRVERRIHDVER